MPMEEETKNDQSVIEFNIDNNSMALNLNQFDLS